MSRLIAICYLIAVGFALRSAIVHNVTASEPLGYYLLLPLTQVHEGDLVWLCEPADAHAFAEAHGFSAVHRDLPVDGCPESRLVIKNAWGLPGDRLQTTRDGVRRNGQLLPDSKPIAKLPDGTPLPTAGPLAVPPGAVWGGSPVQKSFDSRYFGPAPVIARAVPIPEWGVQLMILLFLAFAWWLLRLPEELPPSRA